MSPAATPSRLMTCRANSRECAPSGMLPPPPDWIEARRISPAADDMPSRQVTFEPPPDWP